MQGILLPMGKAKSAEVIKAFTFTGRMAKGRSSTSDRSATTHLTSVQIFFVNHAVLGTGIQQKSKSTNIFSSVKSHSNTLNYSIKIHVPIKNFFNPFTTKRRFQRQLFFIHGIRHDVGNVKSERLF